VKKGEEGEGMRAREGVTGGKEGRARGGERGEVEMAKGDRTLTH